MKDSTRTLLKAIKAKCLDCCGGASIEVEQCPMRTCPLYPFRSGKTITLLQQNPNSKDEQLLLFTGEEFPPEEEE